MTNKELQEFQNVISLLKTIKCQIKNKNVEISIIDLEKNIQILEEICTKKYIQKAKKSKASSEYTKKHKQRHRANNRINATRRAIRNTDLTDIKKIEKLKTRLKKQIQQRDEIIITETPKRIIVK